MKLIPTQAHKNYLKKKLRRKKKVLQTNLNMLETAQSLEHKEQERALEMKARKAHSEELEEISRGARRKSRSRSKNSRKCTLGYKACTCNGIAEQCRGYVE